MTAAPGPRLLRLYRRTDYVIEGRVHVAIGRRSGGSDALLLRMGARRGVILTAANPRSRFMADGWNRRMTSTLALGLRGLPSMPAEGRLGGWREAGLLVCGDPRRLARVGRRFRQNALVVVEAGRPARLMVLARA